MVQEKKGGSRKQDRNWKLHESNKRKELRRQAKASIAKAVAMGVDRK